MLYHLLRSNQLKSFESVSEAALSSMTPYLSLLEDGRINSGSGATFRGKTIHLECVSRLLWGALPYLKGNNKTEAGVFQPLIDYIIKGTNPEHRDFWGIPGNYDQTLVEMPVIALSIILKPELFWDPFSMKTRDRISSWLGGINRSGTPECNWILFPLLVNAALLKVKPELADRKLMKSSIDKMESFYIGSGWYNDGSPGERRSRDYYIPWAYYFFGLIFITICPDFDPDFTSRLIERTQLFAKEYRLWFAPDGAGLPYGRSLSYRYAQSAFWGALVFSGIEALPWAEVKGLWARNMRWWFKQDYFSETGIQQIGYTYPNMFMSERYNSPSSPLWALQAFLPLAVGKDHPFWKCEEAPLVQSDNIEIQESTGFIFNNISGNKHVYVISNGQWTPGSGNEHNHMAEKYEKFAYSCSFGFNISTDLTGIDKLAPDNMLLIAKEKDYYRCKKSSTNHFISKEYSSSRWSPFNDVVIDTYQIPMGLWIIRVHHVKCKSPIFTVEGGFPLPYDDRDFDLSKATVCENNNRCYLETSFGGSGIYDWKQLREGHGINTGPNSNIQHPHTYVPTLNTTLAAGEHFLVSAVIAHPEKDISNKAWYNKPEFKSCCLCLPEEIVEQLVGK